MEEEWSDDSVVPVIIVGPPEPEPEPEPSTEEMRLR